MKVVLVTSIERGGPVEHVRLLARELVAAGARVRAVTTAEPVAEAYAAAGADPVLVPSGTSSSGRGARWATGPTVVRRCSKGFDVVHSHDRRSGLWVLGPPRRRAGAARVHTLHGLPDPYLPLPGADRAGLRDHAAYRVVEARLVGRADALVVPSRATLDRARRLGYRTAEAVVVRNGVDIPAVPVRAGSRIGMLTALEPVKGVDVFLDAAAVVHAADPGARFVVFGTGSLRADVQAQAQHLGLTEVVELAGRVPAATALEDLRVLVSTSHFETSPLALLEAMAAGVPVVATRVGGVAELAPADAMVLVPPNDPASTARAILRTVQDDAGRQAQVERARCHVERERTATATMEAMVGLYERVLDRRAP